MVSRASIMPRSTVLSLAVIGLAAWPFTPAAAASFQVSTNAMAGSWQPFPNVPPVSNGRMESGTTGPVSSSISAHQDEGPGFIAGDGLAHATVDLGYFSGCACSHAITKAGYIDAIGQEFQFYAQSFADVSADSGDSILVMPANPMLIGTVGTMVVPLDVHGTLSATISPYIHGRPLGSDSYAYTHWSMFVTTSTGTMPGVLMGTVDTYGATGDMPGPHTLTLDLVLGVPTSLNLNYQLHSQAFVRSSLLTGGQADGTAGFVGTIRWMGIDEVRDADGNPIEYSLSSDSGFDWTQPAPAPVPVPPVLLPLMIAVWASGAHFARRREACR